MSLRVLGCGDAFGSGGRFHTCFYLDAPETKLLIDFGASALVSMHRFGIDPRAIDAITVPTKYTQPSQPSSLRTHNAIA